MDQPLLYQADDRQENQFLFKNDNNNIQSNILLIFSQILVWILLIYTLINPEFYQFLVIAYVIYIIIVEMYSHARNFLLNKNSTKSIYNKLKELYKSPPILKVSISCFHYEIKIEETSTSSGKRVKRKKKIKVETYSEKRNFSFYSFRDISGLFRVDLNNEIFRNKTYIKLNLDTVISFADSISCYDYQIFKEQFINENRNKDMKMDFRENFYIHNLSRNNLIKIKDEEPFYFNFFFFFLCTILTMALPYEIMLDNISIEGKYQIKKIISTRYNLNSYEYDGVYGNTIPAIKLGNNTYNFNSDDYGYYDQNAEINLPTMEEIENAKKYEEEIKKPIYDDHLYNENNNVGYPDLDLSSQEENDYVDERRKNE